MLEYYDRFAFDYGVSVDHLVVPEYASEAHRRYELTLRNAEDFLALHRTSKYSFVPVGAIQGWDSASYTEASQHLARAGYTYLAIGGVARSNTRTVESIVRAVRDAVGDQTRLHVLGVARAKLLPLFVELGIESVDSAAPIRCAWLSAHENYFTLDSSYAAIRIPIAEQERPKPDTLVGRSSHSLGTLRRAESDALRALRAYDKRQLGLMSAMNAILAYDDLLAERRDSQTRSSRAMLYRATLAARPWRRCDCPICRNLGVEVIIFRGNNRNRRRGFHNCYVVRRRLEALKTPRDNGPAPDPKEPNMSYNGSTRTQHVVARKGR
jgi:queuine/archaeosine tRNA-ribosyltransferase